MKQETRIRHWTVADTSTVSKAAKEVGSRIDIKLARSIRMRGENNSMYGKKHSAETLRKMRVAQLGKKQSAESNRKNRLWQLNNPCKVFSNTTIEQAIAKALTNKNVVFRQNVNLLNIANVDFYLQEYRIAIQCDGCYWHGCPAHFPERVRAYDKLQDAALARCGINVVRFWEHDIRENSQQLIDSLI